MQSLSRKILAAGLVALLASAGLAATKVGVRGSSNQYATEIDSTIDGQQVKMVLTGAALRKKVIFNVYTVGSYLQQGGSVRSAEDLAEADCPKQLHLIMERDVEGKEMAEAFRTAIRANYADPAFAAELDSLTETMESIAVKKGDHVWLTHVPKKGLHCNLVGKKDFFIENADFARAVWNIYLGPKNLGDDIKKALVSRL
jgi:hypothetical protein